MRYRADITNGFKKLNHSVYGTNIGDLKALCKNPGFNYYVSFYAIYDDLPDELVISYHYKNNKFYKI